MKSLKTAALSILLLYVSALSSTSWGQDFDQGMAAAKRGDYVEAMREWRPLAEDGDALAQYLIGDMYESGKGVARDLPEALRWYRKAAQKGNVRAQFNIWVIYQTGADGIAPDYEEANRWYRKVVANDRADPVKARRVWRAIAEEGDTRAQYRTGRMYEVGHGGDKDIIEAVKWYRMAAKKGFAPAQSSLGKIYRYGKKVYVCGEGDNKRMCVGPGVAKDQAVSVEWYRKAALTGYGPAQFELGDMYFRGHGVAADPSEGIKWQRKAAMQGYAEAQHHMAVHFLLGKGVARDFVKAHMWSDIAASKQYQDSSLVRALAARRMSPAQISEAEKLAVEWLAAFEARKKK